MHAVVGDGDAPHRSVPRALFVPLAAVALHPRLFAFRPLFAARIVLNTLGHIVGSQPQAEKPEAWLTDSASLSGVAW